MNEADKVNDLTEKDIKGLEVNKMSEEEIIKLLKSIEFNTYEWDINNYKGNLDNISFKEVTEALQGILDLYNKEKEKNKRLEEKRKNGTLSDGFHTYNDLYYQRCILFATICNSNKNIAWKSKKHSDGKKCFDSDNWFIVGIDTPEGTYTYHYEMKYWDLFKVKELENGKEWDGHTEKDVTRLLSLTNNYISKDKIREIKKELDERIYLHDDDTYNIFKYLTVGEAILIKRFIEKELSEDENE